VDTKQTTCGNCHVGQQADWIQTGHAQAWDDLQASPDNDATCEGAKCHTVNWRGNQDSANVGYDSVKTAAYYHVQCESCHGPGFLHVTNPSVKANRPLASINVTDDPLLTSSSCSGCHRAGAGPDRHQDYLTEWKSSRHGQLRATQAAEPDCQPCHEAKGALRAWGVNSFMRSQRRAPPICRRTAWSATIRTAPPRILPQASPWPGQLRYSISTSVIPENLCTKCHGRVDRSEANPTNARGPHGAQGPVLFGTAGYFPPGTIYDTTAILTSHGSTANPRMCAGCHVNTLTNKDADGNKFQFSGHTFHPLPCLASKTATDTLVDPTYTNACAYDEPSRSWPAALEGNAMGRRRLRSRG
jgi:hypothetical protein